MVREMKVTNIIPDNRNQQEIVNNYPTECCSGYSGDIGYDKANLNVVVVLQNRFNGGNDSDLTFLQRALSQQV